MPRANALLSLFLALVAIVAITTAHPFRHSRMERRSLHRQANNGIHRRSDTTMDTPQVKESLRDRNLTRFAIRVAALEQLRSDTLPSIEARQGSTESSTHTVELPFTVEQLQHKLEAFMQALSDVLAAMFGSTSTSTLPPTADASSSLALILSIDSAPVATFTLAESPAATSAGPTSSFDTALSSPTQVLSTRFVYTLSTATPTVSVQHPTFIISTQSSSTSVLVSTNRSEPYVFDPMSNDNVVVYYGQTTKTYPVPLTQVCADSNVDMVILAFVPTLFGPGSWPTLNMGPHCWAASTAQTQAGATGLIDCVSDGFAKQVQRCQDSGKKVLLSLGGAQGYSDTTVPSDQDAEMLASKLWNLFLGGTESPQTNAIRPFGNVVLDGIDLDNESGTTAHIAPLISALRALFSSSAATKPYFLSAAPQCPRPDASMPLASMQTALDFVWVQFYNNPSCNLASGTSFFDSLSAWSSDLAASASKFVNTGNGVSGPRLYIGAPAWPGAGSGYVDASAFRSLLQSVNGAHMNFGGVMFWDGAFGEQSAGTDGSNETFMRIVKDVLA